MITDTTATTAANDINALVRFLTKFTVLRGAMRELWLTFIIKLLVIAAYSITNSTLVLWFISDLGYSDEKALGLVGIWSLLMTLFNVLVGSLTDAIGMRRTFFWGVGICIFARAVMVFIHAKWAALLFGLCPLAIGEALTGPVLVAAARVYSNTKQRSLSFSMVYIMMNIGFTVAGFVFDWVRKGLGEHGHWTLPILGMQLTTYQTLFLSSLILQCLIWPLIYCLREGVEATDDGVKTTVREKKYQKEKTLTAFSLTVRDTVMDTARLFGGLLKESGFYRLLAFLVFVAFLKLIYKQMDYVFPKVSIRLLGDGAPIGRLLSINTILIIPLVFIIGALTQKFTAYAMVIVGGVISAASVFILALPAAWFVPLANTSLTRWFCHWYLGLNGDIDPFYVSTTLFVVLLSFGEAFYSPRVYEYAAAIAPEGQEASYSALSYIPFLLAKMMTGAFSGILMAKYIPETGVRHPESMWLVLASTAAVAPLGLFVLGRFIRLREAGRED